MTVDIKEISDFANNYTESEYMSDEIISLCHNYEKAVRALRWIGFDSSDDLLSGSKSTGEMMQIGIDRGSKARDVLKEIGEE